MRQLGSTTDSMDKSLRKLWETVKDREAWRAAAHGATKSETGLETEQQQKLKKNIFTCKFSSHCLRKRAPLCKHAECQDLSEACIKYPILCLEHGRYSIGKRVESSTWVLLLILTLLNLLFGLNLDRNQLVYSRVSYHRIFGKRSSILCLNK